MKKHSAIAYAIIALSFPVAVFAQTDGGTGSVEPAPAVTAPRESALAPAPSPQEAPPAAQQQAVASPSPTPSPSPASAAAAPAPPPSPALMPAARPSPSPSPAATNAAPEAVAAPTSQPDEPPSLEDVQGAVEEIAEYAPEPMQPVLAAVAGALGGIVFMLGLWEFLKRLKHRGKKDCDHCGGTGTQSDDGKCGLCGGSKKIEKEVEVTIACTHCKGSGTDPCHHCSGTGKMSLPNPPQSQEELEGWPPCDFCGGSGKKKVGAGRDWGEANDAMKGDFACCFCHGKKTATFKQKVQIDCPLCAKK